MAGDELHALAADLKAAGATVIPKASLVVRRSGIALANHARANAAVDTGFMQSSIDTATDSGGLAMLISPTAEYSVYVEYGTSRMPPQPFMGPALDAIEPSFISAMESLGGEVLR